MPFGAFGKAFLVYLWCLRQAREFPSTAYMFVMQGSFMLALLSVFGQEYHSTDCCLQVTTSQHVLYYLRRLDKDVQRVAFHARAGWMIEIVSHCFQISVVSASHMNSQLPTSWCSLVSLPLLPLSNTLSLSLTQALLLLPHMRVTIICTHSLHLLLYLMQL